MRDGRRAGVLDRVEGGERSVEVVEQALTAAEQHRRDRDVQLVDEPGAKVLPDRRGAAAEPYVAKACSSADSMPSETKWNVVPPFISTGRRSWCVRTKTG